MNPLLGLALVLSAGALNGSYALPMKKTRRWEFENTWLIYSVIAMLVLNWAIALNSVPNLTDVYVRAGIQPVLMVFAFGLIWGLGNLLFGVAIYLIGISLTFPICIGLSTALGSLIPMALDPQIFLSPGGATITLGVAVLVAGVVVCALAGLRMEAQAKSRGVIKGEDTVRAGRNGLKPGLTIALLSGLCDPFLNFAFTFGDRVKQEAIAAGASAGAESDAIWALALLGSFVVNAVYCTRLLTRNATWARFRQPGTASHWLMAGMMAFIWMFSITLYGRGASMMGPLGGSAGWAVFYCSIIISSTFWGIVSGEWREGRGRPVRILYFGLMVLMAAIVILGYGNTLPTSS